MHEKKRHKPENRLNFEKTKQNMI